MTGPLHTMLDLETLGTRPGSAILSIGACRFDPDKGIVYQDATSNPFYMTVSMKSCFDIGLTFECATFEWWMKQSDAARQEAFKGEHPVKSALAQFSRWYLTHKGPIWCHGACFDVPLLEVAYRKAVFDIPWDFRKVRDTRTIFDLTNMSIPRPEGTTLHNALDDAINQAKAVCEAYKIISDWRTSHSREYARNPQYFGGTPPNSVLKN